MTNEKLLTKREVAEYLHIKSTKTIERLCKRNLLSYILVGRQVRFRPEDVQSYIEKFRVEMRR